MESNVDAISYSLQNDIQRETDNIKYLSYNAKLRGSLENGLKREVGSEKTRITLKQSGVLKMTGFMRHE